MLEKMILNPNENLSPAIVQWKEDKEDYVIDVPKDITRSELIELVDEIKRLTQWQKISEFIANGLGMVRFLTD